MSKEKKKKKGIRPGILITLLLLVILAIWTLTTGVDQLAARLYPDKYGEFVEKYAAENELDPLLVYSIIRTESGFDPNAESGVGARGLMQITEETFQWIKSKIARDEDLTFDDLFDPETNIRFGTYYFSRCMTRYNGHVGTAAAAYHSGWGTVDRLLENPEYTDSGTHLHTYPYKQMGWYVEKIGRAYEYYQKIYQKEE